MGLIIDVPLNTSLADLDEALRSLLKRELERHGFEGVDISFDAPSREWSGKLTGPTVSLFLYDLREAVEQSDITGDERRGNGTAVITPPALRLEATYAITAWSKAVEDEHRLLSQMISILHSYRELPPDLLGPRLAMPARSRRWLAARWRRRPTSGPPSVGITRRRSISHCGSRSPRAPPSSVDPRSGRRWSKRRLLRRSPGPHGRAVPLRRHDLRRRRAAARPRLDDDPRVGAWTSSDRAGRFIFDRVRPGCYRLRRGPPLAPRSPPRLGPGRPGRPRHRPPTEAEPRRCLTGLSSCHHHHEPEAEETHAHVPDAGCLRRGDVVGIETD